MLQMNPDMPDAEDDDSENQPDIESVDPEKEKSKHRKRRAGNRKTAETAVLVTHGLSAPEVTIPVQFIQDHQKKRGGKPQAPQRPCVRIKIPENQHDDTDKDLADPFQKQKKPVLVFGNRS